eukprot:scaffold227851_cov30-Tisochrysis_lutea.AAC.1
MPPTLARLQAFETACMSCARCIRPMSSLGLIACTSLRSRLLADARTHIYVCGAANQMPKAVRAALADAAVRQCLVDSTEEAMGMLAKMEMERRLQFETW